MGSWPEARHRAQPLIVLLFGFAAAGLSGAEGAKPSAEAVATAGWRGNGSGVFADATPPTTWSPTTNVAWSTPLPSISNASPVVIAGRVLCCSDPDSLVCLDAASGKLLWSKKNPLEEGATPEQMQLILAARKEGQPIASRLAALQAKLIEANIQARQNSHDQDLAAQKAALSAQVDSVSAELAPYRPYLAEWNPLGGATYPTPVSDGRHVWAVFSTGVVACYDLDGNRKWIRYVETPTVHDGQSSSPILVGGKLLIQIQHLHALDPDSGETAWTVESKKATHATAVALLIGGAPTALLSSGGIVRASDGHPMLAEGASIWWTSAIVHDDMAYFCNQTWRALHLRGRSADEIDGKPLWSYVPPQSPVWWHASPVYCGDCICGVTDMGRFIAVGATTGKLVYETQWDERNFFQPLTVAGHFLFVCNLHGTTHVLDAKNGFAEVACNRMEPFGSTPAFSGDRMYLRTSKAMYCFAGH